jgi:hypothetical protein
MRLSPVHALAAGLALAICTGSSLSDAGYVYPAQVTVSSTEGVGSLVGARYSSDSKQEIGCETYGYGAGSSVYTYCWAEDLSGKYVSCYASDPATAQIAGQINSASEITFYFNTAATCTTLYVSNGSQYIH